MKAMILAAGLGTRLRPLTLLRAKPVLPVLNRPLLHWTLEQLSRHGVREVVINTHYRPADVRRAVGDGRAFGLRVAYAHEPRILGTGGGPRAVRRFFGKEPFLLVNGDVVFDFDLSRLLRRHRESGARATLALLPNPDPRLYAPVVTRRDGRVLAIAGRPGPAQGALSLFASIHVLDPALLRRLPEGFSDSVRDLYPALIREGEPVVGLRMRGPWYDLSSPPLYLASQMSLLAQGFGGARGRSRVHADARVEAAARVRHSLIGRGCRVEAGASIEESVLWEGVRVAAGARVRRSVLTDRVTLEPGESVEGMMVLRAGRGIGGLGRPRRGQHYVELGA